MDASGDVDRLPRGEIIRFRKVVGENDGVGVDIAKGAGDRVDRIARNNRVLGRVVKQAPCCDIQVPLASARDLQNIPDW